MMRALLLLHLLTCNRNGLTIESIAERCGVSTRTVYRDLDALEEVFGAKFYKEDNRYLLVAGTVLPPVMFTVPEATAVFMASRLLLQQSSVFNQHIESTFIKLGSALSPPLRDEVMKTLEWMRRRRVDREAVAALDTISQCWNARRQVRILYRPLNARECEERVIEPYFIQPSALERAVYVIAWCRLRDELRVFRLDRVVAATALESTYVIPQEFDANEYLNSYWSITASGEPRTVRLRFRPEVARIATETVWHSSQTTEMEMDGSATVTLRVATTRDLVSFVLGWGDMVEILAPRSLQVDVARAARRVVERYSGPGESARHAGAAGGSGPVEQSAEETDAAERVDGVMRDGEPAGVQLELFASTAAGPVGDAAASPR